MHSPLSRRDLFRPADQSGQAARAQDVVHIASLLLQVLPDRIDALREVVDQLSGAELHGTAHPGKFAVVLEAGNERVLADATERLSALPGVLTVSIVAHLTEQASAMDEEWQP